MKPLGIKIAGFLVGMRELTNRAIERRAHLIQAPFTYSRVTPSLPLKAALRPSSRDQFATCISTHTDLHTYYAGLPDYAQNRQLCAKLWVHIIT